MTYIHIHTYIYVYTYIYTHTHIYTYIVTDRNERRRPTAATKTCASRSWSTAKSPTHSAPTSPTGCPGRPSPASRFLCVCFFLLLLLRCCRPLPLTLTLTLTTTQKKGASGPDYRLSIIDTRALESRQKRPTKGACGQADGVAKGKQATNPWQQATNSQAPSLAHGVSPSGEPNETYAADKRALD